MRIAALTVIMTLCAAGARGEEARPYTVTDCEKFTTQMDLNRCAMDNLKSADKALNNAYQALMAKQDDAASKHRLKDVQRAPGSLSAIANARLRLARRRPGARSGRRKSVVAWKK